MKKNIELLLESKSILSINELGRSTGLSVSIISRLLSGITKKPSDETIRQIANYFDISPCDLMFKDLSNTSAVQKEQFIYKHDNIKDRILYLMRKKNILSIYELSKLTGVEYDTLNVILIKDTKNPHIETCRKLANFFGISIRELKCEEDLPINLFNEIMPKVPVINFNSVSEWLSTKNINFIESFIKIDASHFNESMFFMKPTGNFDEESTVDLFLFEKTDNLTMAGKYLVIMNNEFNLKLLFPNNSNFYYLINDNKKKIPCKKSEIQICAKLIRTHYK